MLVRQDTAQDDSGLAGEHEADEQGGLGERQPADKCVGRRAVQFQDLVDHRAEHTHRGAAVRSGTWLPPWIFTLPSD